MLRRLAPVCALFALAAPASALAAPAGSLDASFGDGGVTRLAVGTGDSTINDLVAYGGGWAAVGSARAEFDNPRAAVARFTAAGAPDGAFGSGGATVLAQPAISPDRSDYAEGYDLLATPSGLLMSGHAYFEGGNDKQLLARFDDAGALDPAFSGDGFLLDGEVHTFAGALAPADGGDVLAAVTEYGIGRSQWALRRYTAAGDLDTSFSGDGVARLPQLGDGPQDWVRGVWADGDDAILAGSADTANGAAAAIARVNAAGTVTSKALLPFPGGSFTAYSGVRTADGGVVLGGYVERDADGTTSWALARFTAAGTPDTTFGDGGRIVTGALPGAISDLALDVQGRIVTAGRTDADAMTVARYLPDGTLDGSFGDAGVANVALDGGAAAAVTTDGDDVLVGGKSDNADRRDFTIAKLLGAANGDPVAGESDSDGDDSEPVAEQPAFVEDGVVSASGGSTTRGAFRVKLVTRRIGKRKVVNAIVSWPSDWRGRAVLRVTRVKHPVVLGSSVVRGRAGASGHIVGVRLNRLGRKLIRRGNLRIRVSLVPVG